jgi:ABC-2 type transport system ATP-binding protein
MSEAVLELINVSKKYGNRKAVDNVSLEVKPGEIYGFIGPNGAGKTTTIKMIVGLAAMSGGEIKICGYSLKKDFENAIRQVGGIIENPELYGFLTGMQNLELFAGLYKGITKQRIYKVITLVGLENRIHDKVKKYSLGMKQRLGIAQSLLHTPKLLILDEPTNGLDPSGIREMRQLLKKLAHEEGVSVFISSHILSEMQLLCDRAAIIDKGKTINVLTLEELNTSALSKFTIKTTNPQKAAEILKQKYPDTVLASEGYINLSESEDKMPGVIETLVHNGIGVYCCKPVAQNLETMYLDATHGSRIN